MGRWRGYPTARRGICRGFRRRERPSGLPAAPPLMQPPHLPGASEKDPESPDERPGIG